MATSSFSGTNFRVIATSPGFYPLPERDADGLPHYRATVKLASATDYKALADLVSLVTLKRALGSYAFVAVVDAGPSSATLSVPVAAGTLGAFTALLVACKPISSGRQTTDFRADCDWAILSDSTP